MRRNHPNLNCGALFATVALAAYLCGCGANRQTASINPFLGPGRVPPPATRILPPGAAQPYYPGDPLPTMHSATNGAPAPAQLAVATSMAAAPATRLASSNEPAVSIPIDNSALRFAAPKPPPEPAPFAAASDTVVMAVPEPTPASRQAAQAVYTEPYDPAIRENAIDVSATGPWRSPRVPVAVASPSDARPAVAPTSAHVANPWSSPPSTMDVRLRAVPSPPLESLTPSAPRIRLPGPPLQTQVYVMPDGSMQHVSYTVVPVSPNDAAVASDAAPHLAAEPQAATFASRDGFRPRGSMR